jgi:hypothetical protein
MRLFCARDRTTLPPLRRITAGPIWLASTIRERLVEWLRRLRVELWIVEGEERSSHLPLKVLCGLRGETKNYLLKLIFGDRYRQGCLGRFWLWKVLRAVPPEAADCSLVVVWTCGSHLKRFARTGDWFLLPEWVQGEMDLPRDAAATRRLRGNLQRVRQHGFQYEVTRDGQQFDDFYRNMYVPYTCKMFGDCAYVYSHRQLRRIFRCCDLLLVEQDKQTVGGVLLDYRYAKPRMRVLGIRDADRNHVKNGAVCAIYEFSSQYLQGQGHKKVQLGWSRPFLRDGVLEFKRKWSQVIVGGRYWGFGLRVASPTPAVRSFLRENPFILTRDGRLHAACFVDADATIADDEIERIKKEHSHTGLAGVEILRLPSEGCDSLTGQIAVKQAGLPAG